MKRYRLEGGEMQVNTGGRWIYAQVSKDLEAENIRLKMRNPVVVARALELYEFNQSSAIRVSEWWSTRYPLRRMFPPDAKEWLERFRGHAIPREMDPWSLTAYVECAMARYGEEASKVYGVCGFRDEGEMVANQDNNMHEFSGDWKPMSAFEKEE